MASGERADLRLLCDDGCRGGSCCGLGHHHRRLPGSHNPGRRQNRPDETMTSYMSNNLHLWLIPLLPFAGFLINGLLGRRLPKALVTGVALLASLGSFLVVLVNVFGMFGSMHMPASLPVVE